MNTITAFFLHKKCVFAQIAVYSNEKTPRTGLSPLYLKSEKFTLP